MPVGYVGPKAHPSTLDLIKLFLQPNHQTFSRYLSMYIPQNTKHPPQHHEF